MSNVCAPTTSFAKTVDNPNPRVGSTITYTLALNNSNDTGAETNLTISDTLPPGYVVSGVTGSLSGSSAGSVGHASDPSETARRARTGMHPIMKTIIFLAIVVVAYLAWKNKGMFTHH